MLFEKYKMHYLTANFIFLANKKKLFFQFCLKHGIGRTAHAGEKGSSNEVKNVRFFLFFQKYFSQLLAVKKQNLENLYAPNKLQKLTKN